jgi:hypothetical protein
MDLNTLAKQTNTATDAGQPQGDESQAQEKFYSQKEFDDAMARTRIAVERKMTKTLSELGDIEELRALRQQVETTRFEEQKSKGDYEQILKDLASKKDAEIAKRDALIAQYRVDSPLVEIAAKHRAVAPEQVKALLRNQIKLTPDGEVEVVDTNGTTRYKDNGDPFGVEDLVKSFLDSNPHFVSAGPSTTQTKSSMGSKGTSQQIDITKLDMRKPGDRAIYAKWRGQQGN